jgi:NTE family protein
MTKDYSSYKNKPDKQRALVLQGGGALGAYECGVLKGLCTELTEEDKKEGKEDRSLFDIVAGTSIGAMNAAVLVGNVAIKNKSWKDAIAELEKFWRDGIALKEGPTSDDDIPPPEMFPMFSWWGPWTKEFPWWRLDGKKIPIKDLASKEAARRYYSTKVFVAGAGKVFSLKGIRDDYKFFDEAPNAKWFLLNDEPLKKQIEEFGKFPIGTRFDKGQPRLLVTAVDIAEGITVTFDSYKKSDGKRKTVYYPRGKYGHKKEDEYSNNNNQDDSKPIVIKYDEGITIEHIMASGTLPECYDPKEICNDSKDEICKRKFWDGGLLSNTPLRELLEAHRDYWVNVENKDEAPDLEVYIVNVHPSTIDVNNIPNKYDEVKDRSNDIVYGDRTFSDQYAASLVTDYIDLINHLKSVAINHFSNKDESDKFQRDFANFLERTDAKSKGHSGERRTYKDLTMGRFELTNVKRIERKYDANTSTSFKTGDITPETIDKLIKEGEKDAKDTFIS